MQNGMKQVDGECCSRVDEQTHQSSVKLAVETLMATFKKKNRNKTSKYQGWSLF